MPPGGQVASSSEHGKICGRGPFATLPLRRIDPARFNTLHSFDPNRIYISALLDACAGEMMLSSAPSCGTVASTLTAQVARSRPHRAVCHASKSEVRCESA